VHMPPTSRITTAAVESIVQKISPEPINLAIG
jgi:hypothetical protein